MSEKQPYQHSSQGAGHAADSPSAETEHRDTAHGSTEQRNELNPDERNRTTQYGPRTHDDTRIDPDPRFEETDQEERNP